MSILILDDNGEVSETQREPVLGDYIQITDGSHITKKRYYPPTQPDKESSERAWRNGELERTDRLAVITDYPYTEILVRYRKALRNYPGGENFPNTDRPTKPQNIK